MKSTIHMVGIKGQGMAALAEILKARGANVAGSDIKVSFSTDAVLKAAHIPVRPFIRSNITKKIDKVIYSSAYRLDQHSELKEAIKKGIPLQSYAEALAELFNQFPHRIIVTGTHGKSTTSAMIGHIFTEAGYDPTVIVGGEVLNWKRNSRIGHSNWIVAEGDEYQAKILLMRPTFLVLTSIDYDHPDFFPTKAAYQHMFRKMKAMLPADRIIMLPAKDTSKHCYDSPRGLPRVKAGEAGRKLKYVFGAHNQRNAELAARAARLAGVKNHIIDKALQSFRGVGRRLEYHSDPEATTVLLEDYAHHPTEIKAALSAMRERYPKRQIITIFQPHTFSRTAAFFDDFARSFENSDAVIFLETFGSARENIGTATAEKLSRETAKHHPHARYAATQKRAALLARHLLKPPAVLLIMGAGDVNKILSRLL